MMSDDNLDFNLRTHLRTNIDIGYKEEIFSKLKKSSPLLFESLKKFFSSGGVIKKIEFVEAKSLEAIYQDSSFISGLSKIKELIQLEVLQVGFDYVIFLSNDYLILSYKDRYF